MMFTENLSMSSTISLPTCSCCNRPIMPNDKCVKLNCPECGVDLIWRCESCREAQEVIPVPHVIFKDLKQNGRYYFNSKSSSNRNGSGFR